MKMLRLSGAYMSITTHSSLVHQAKLYTTIHRKKKKLKEEEQMARKDRSK